MTHPFNKIAGCMAEKIHSYNEQGGINNTRYQYPFPQFVFLYEPVGLEISLYANNHFFQHIGGI